MAEEIEGRVTLVRALPSAVHKPALGHCVAPVLTAWRLTGLLRELRSGAPGPQWRPSAVS